MLTKMSVIAKSALLTLIHLLILSSFTETKQDLYKFMINRMTCEDFDPRIIVNYSCSTDKISRDLRSLSIAVIPYPNMSFNHLYVRIDYLHRIGPTYKRSVISVEENFCVFLADTSKGSMIRMFWPSIKKSSNLKDRCPYSGVFNMSQMIFDDTLLPPALPEGQARIDIRIRDGPERLSLIRVKLYIEVKPKGAANLDF